MSVGDPVEDYSRALDTLTALTGAVARQEHQREVVDALSALRLAVARAYGGQTVPTRKVGARRVILDHLRANLGEWVSGEELAAVSGIGEWARRVRELRVELGYDIDEQRGHYRLASGEPDEARRTRWVTVTEVRGMHGAPLDSARLLLERLVGQVVTLDELGRASRSKDPAALARRLREAEQLPVEMTGDAPDLGTGRLRLASSRDAFLLPPSQRLHAEDVRARVFSRDGYRCSVCRRDHASAGSTPERPFYLVVRHMAAGPGELAGLPVDRLIDLSLLDTRCNECFGRRSPSS